MTKKQFGIIGAIICYNSLFCGVLAHNNSGLFSDFARALDKITSAQSKKPPLKKPVHPFATHSLVIVCGLTESNISLKKAIKKLFSEKVTFITTSSLLYEYRETMEKDRNPLDYTFLAAPSLTILPFVLCIPTEEIPKTIAIPDYQAAEIMNLFDHNETPAKATVTEKKLGLFIEHLNKLDYQESLFSPSFFEELEESLGDELLKFLNFLFVPNNYYTKKESSPRWILLFDGHGSSFTPWMDENILDLKEYIMEPGTIAGITTKAFATILKENELHKTITIALLDIETCFGGGINISNMLKQLDFSPQYFITTKSLTGDDCITSSSGEAPNPYKDFFDILKTTDINAIETELPQALRKLHPQLLSLASNIPAIKPIGKNYFIAPNYPEFIQLDKTTIRNFAKQKKAVNPSEIAIMLLYANTIPLYIDLSNRAPLDLFGIRNTPNYAGFPVAITSAIPGRTFHVIDEIKIPSGPFGYSFLQSKKPWILHLFSDMSATTTGAKEPKLFHIKKISESTGLEEYELRIICDPTSDPKIESLFNTKESLNTEYVKITRSNQSTDYIEEKITKEGADEWIEEFDKRIEMLKKIAKYQAPYRLLKDADIEILDED